MSKRRLFKDRLYRPLDRQERPPDQSRGSSQCDQCRKVRRQDQATGEDSGQGEYRKRGPTDEHRHADQQPSPLPPRADRHGHNIGHRNQDKASNAIDEKNDDLSPDQQGQIRPAKQRESAVDGNAKTEGDGRDKNPPQLIGRAGGVLGTDARYPDRAAQHGEDECDCRQARKDQCVTPFRAPPLSRRAHRFAQASRPQVNKVTTQKIGHDQAR
jgi:hypothetical protein